MKALYLIKENPILSKLFNLVMACVVFFMLGAIVKFSVAICLDINMAWWKSLLLVGVLRVVSTSSIGLINKD